jgi:hypothetical protein
MTKPTIHVKKPQGPSILIIEDVSPSVGQSNENFSERIEKSKKENSDESTRGGKNKSRIKSEHPLVKGASFKRQACFVEKEKPGTLKMDNLGSFINAETFNDPEMMNRTMKSPIGDVEEEIETRKYVNNASNRA